MDYNITFRKKDKKIQAVISYKDNKGIWKQKCKQGFDTQKAAKPWIDKTIDKLKETVKYINPEYENTTFKELYDDFIKHTELYNEPNTIINYDNIKIHFETLFDKKVSEITPLNIQECVDTMIKKKLKASSIISHTTKLKTVFKYSVTNKIIKDNPALSIILPENKDKKKRKEIKALTKEETDDLLSKITRYKYYLMSLIVATCGLRIGELLGLTWDRIDEKNLTMTINRQWKIKTKPNTYGFGTVKRVNSNRVVPIPSFTMSAIKSYKEKYPINISGRLFPYKSTNSISSSLITTYKSVGYEVSIHDLRHTYASMLVASGLDFKTIAELMGHSVEETINTYSHFTKDMMVKATKVVNDIF